MGFVSNITVMSCAHTVNAIELNFGPQTVVQKKYNSDKKLPSRWSQVSLSFQSSKQPIDATVVPRTLNCDVTIMQNLNKCKT